MSINGVQSNVANACLKNNNNRNDDIWKIHIEINTASNKLVAFSIRGTNGTNKASYTLAQETTLNTDISTSLVATMSFVRVKNSPYTGLHSIALYEVTDVEKNTVTYTKGNDNGVYGGSYTEEISSGQEFTCAANTFVYKSGSTLKNWVNSNDAIYNVGTQYDIYNDIELYPAFSSNVVSRTLLASPVDISFPEIVWSDGNVEKCYVKQGLFNGEEQDVAVLVGNKTLALDMVPDMKIIFPNGIGSDFSSDGVFVKDGDIWTYAGEAGLVELAYEGTSESLSGLSVSFPFTYKPIFATDLDVESYELKVGDEKELSVNVLNMENGTYQWYSNTTNSTDGGVAVGTNSASFTIPTAEVDNGITYYYCAATNTYGTTISKIVKVEVIAKPIIHTEIEKNVYALNIGDSQLLSVAAYNTDLPGTSYQWYSRQFGSDDEGIAIDGATSSSFSVPTTDKSTLCYYCVITNNYGSATSLEAVVHVDDYITLNLQGWPSYDTMLGLEGTKAHVLVSGAEFSDNSILYPYGLAGYLGFFDGPFEIVSGTGLRNTSLRAPRPVVLYDLEVGDVVTFIGTDLNTGDVVADGVNGRSDADLTVNDTHTELVALVKTPGHLQLALQKNRANVLQMIKTSNKHRPTIMTNLTGETYTIARGETKDLSVVASGENLTYQWYRNDVDSVKGGVLIPDAIEATYTTEPNKSYYYYCVVRNGNTGAAVVSKTARVECNPQVSYVNNDADAIGDVPATEVIGVGEKFTIESRNYQLLKPGYTLTGWTDGTNTYEFGKSYDIVNDIVLNPVFRANEKSLSTITKFTTVTWPFATSKDAPTVNWTDGETHVLAAQQAVTGERQDFGAKVASTGFATGSATATVAEGTTIKIPMKYGTTIELFTSGVTPSATVLTTDLKTPRNMTADGSTLT